jgi:hypothetical protein
MAIVENLYTGNGSTTLYSFTFPYLDESHVKVTLNGTPTTAYVFASATSLQFTSAPGAGVAIRIYRETDDTELEATFFPGSSIRAADLNNDFDQLLYLGQESSSIAGKATVTANTALTNSNTAISTANSAVVTANAADAAAAAAVITANTAESNSLAAVSTANTASSNASAAVSTANAASSAASAAVITANAASSTASQAAIDAAAAVVTANAADGKADAAVLTANAADANASAAVITANAADVNASAAVVTANTAESNSLSAISTANSAAAAVASAVLYQPVVDLAALALLTPLDGDFFELQDSTGADTDPSITGVPGGLVGAAGLTFRLRYDDPPGEYAFLGYFANDSETRYLKTGTGTVTSTNILDGTIVDADINASAAIADTKLATIATAGKVSNSATTATSSNTVSAIVARDGSGNFSAGTITANLTGTASAIADNIVTSAKIVDGTIVDGDISATAEIAVSKLADGAARQLLQTDAAGTGVEWTDNVDVPGTLDVTGAATLDSTLVVTGDVTVPSLNGGPISGARNRIINGDMRIDQRNAGASVSISLAVNTYFVDRWRANANGGGVFSVQRSTTAPSGFTNSILATVTTADSSVSGGDFYHLRQTIEGFNFADLGFGTSSAQAVTVSFWVRASVTGTYTFMLRNNAGDRGYTTTYSISSANTFEYKTLTIPGDVTGTWPTDNSGSAIVNFNLGAGTSQTLNSWQATANEGATGQAQWIATNGATFYITGVQLEPGTVATPFERRSFGQELALCERYFELCAAGAATQNNAGNLYGAGCNFRTTKRATPTITRISNTESFNTAANPVLVTNSPSVHGFSTSCNLGVTGVSSYTAIFSATIEL